MIPPLMLFFMLCVVKLWIHACEVSLRHVTSVQLIDASSGLCWQTKVPQWIDLIIFCFYTLIFFDNLNFFQESSSSFVKVPREGPIDHGSRSTCDVWSTELLLSQISFFVASGEDVPDDIQLLFHVDLHGGDGHQSHREGFHVRQACVHQQWLEHHGRFPRPGLLDRPNLHCMYGG